MRNHTFSLIIFSFLFTLIAAIPQTTRPPNGAVTIKKVEVDDPSVGTEGSGCRAGTVGVAIGADHSFITLLFDDFQAAIGPKAGNTKKRAFCRVNVTMSSPGWAFDVKSVDFRGYVKLAAGVDVSLVSRWKWIDPTTGQDIKGKGNVQKKAAGPFEEDFLVSKSGELSDSEESVCSTKASAKFQISMSASLNFNGAATNVDGYVKADSADASFGELLRITWRKC